MASIGVRVVVIGLAAVCVVVVGLLVWGASRNQESSAVDDLPTVADIVAAEAHRHGVGVPELTEDEIARLSAAPVPASSLDPFEQVRLQLEAVKSAGGLAEALLILRDVAQQSDQVRADCARLYDALVAGASGATPVGDICSA
ncbi:MAG: hypothetical protein ACKOD2_08670 [Ilumatobacteraceae bacterium]